MNTTTTIAYQSEEVTLEKNTGNGGVWYRLTMPKRCGKLKGITFDNYALAMRHVSMKTEDLCNLIKG